MSDDPFLKPSRITMDLHGHGRFTAPLERAQMCSRRHTKQQLIVTIHGLWPSVFTRTELHHLDKFLLAIILEQDR